MLTGPQKAIAALIITTLTGTIGVLMANLTDNDTIQLWGTIAAGILGVLAVTLGVYQTPNVVKAQTSPAGGEPDTARSIHDGAPLEHSVS